MSNRQVTININVSGSQDVKEAVKIAKQLNSEVNKTTKITGLAAAAQDKLAKGSAQIGKNSTANFAKISQGMGGLVHVYATVAANVFALSSAYLVLKKNADLTIMKESAKELAQATGIAYTQVANDMKRITGGAISFTQAMRQANLALSGGATIEQVKQITKIANQAANTLGLSVPEAVGRMIQAVTKGEPELVDELGIILRITRATEEYAAKLGKTTTQLTTFEKQQAIINQLLEQGNQKFANVTPRTNPYEELISSVEDLGNKLISSISGPISSLASMIAGSNALIFSGIALFVKMIATKAVPEIARIGQTWREKAAYAAQEATAEINNYRKAVLAAREAEKEKRRTSGYVHLIDKNLRENIFPKIDKRTNFGKRIAEAIKLGLKGHDLVKFLNVPKFKKELEFLKDLEMKAGLKKYQIKIAKDSSLKNDLQNLMYQINFGNAQIEAALRVDAAEKEKLAARLKARNVYIKNAFATAIGGVFNATGYKDTIEAFKSGLNTINKNYARAIINQNTWNTSILKGKQAFSKLALGGAVAVKTIGKVASFIPHIAGVIFAFEGFKQVAQWIGLVDEKITKQLDSLSQLNDTINETLDNYKNIAMEMRSLPSNIEESVAKWAKLNSVSNQYTEQLKEIIDTSAGLNNLSFFDKLFNFNFSAEQNAFDSFRKLQEQLKSLTGKENTFSFGINDKRITKVSSYIATITRAIKKAEASGQYTGNLKNKLAEAEAELSRLVKTNKNLGISSITTKEQFFAFIDLINSNPSAMRNWSRAQAEQTKEFNAYALAAKEASASVAALDKQVSDFRRKSESRRALTGDSLINFRDTLQKGTLSLEEFIKNKTKFSSEASKDVLIFFKEIPEAVKKAFNIKVSDVNSPIAIINGLKAAISGMDKQIDALRGLPERLKEIRSIKSIFKAEVNRKGADASNARIAVFKLEVKEIKEKIKAKTVEIQLAKQESVLSEKDKAQRTARIKALQAEKAALEDTLNNKNIEVVYIINAIEANNRYLTTLKEINKVRDTGISVFNKLLSISNKSVNLIANGISVSAIQEQVTLAKSLADSKKAELERDKTSILLKAKQAEAEGARVNWEQVSLSIKDKRLAQLQVELDLQNKLVELNKQQFEAKGKALSVTTTGFQNNFAGLGEGSLLLQELRNIADSMALAANSIQKIGGIIKGGVEAAVGSLVDSLINKNWEGKDKGVSRSVFIREQVKATLRESIGSAIKENMVQSILRIVGSEQSLQASNLSLQSSISGLTGAILANTSALYSTKIPSLDLTNPGNAGELFNISRYAKGGVVHSPELAFIGEGSNSEAVVPLPDNRAIPVELKGERATNVTVTQSFDFRGADASTEAKLRAEANRIKQETIKTIMDNINRGGTMSKVVGRRK